MKPIKGVLHGIEDYYGEGEWLSYDDVKEHTVDKQTLLDAINEIQHQLSPAHTGTRLFGTMLKMKLGLEEE